MPARRGEKPFGLGLSPPLSEPQGSWAPWALTGDSTISCLFPSTGHVPFIPSESTLISITTLRLSKERSLTQGHTARKLRKQDFK